MDWSVTRRYDDANHHPIAVVNGDSTRQVLKLTAAPGAIVKLDTKGSRDPDQDALEFDWSIYEEPGTYRGEVEIKDDRATTAMVSTFFLFSLSRQQI